MASAMRVEVVKSGRRRPSSSGLPSRLGVTARSMEAPPGTLPEVGWFFCSRAPVRRHVEAARLHRPLGQRVHRAVGAGQRRDQQHAAGQRAGVAQRADVDVDAGARAGEGGQAGRHHHRGHVAHAHVAWVDPDAQPPQHAADRLGGEEDPLAVAGAGQADHQAVAVEGVFPHPLHVDQLLDPHRAPAEAGRAPRSDAVSRAMRSPGEWSLHQNGHIQPRKRDSHPCFWLSVRTPRPTNSISASATIELLTLFS